MDELQELMAAAETIKKYCSENECSSCPFWQPRAINPFDDLARVCVINGSGAPCDWKLTTESDEDKEAKQHG